MNKVIEHSHFIESVVKDVGKRFGAQSVGRMSEFFIEPQLYVPTGNLALDWVIGRPGIPSGRIVEIAGPPGSCKSTLCVNIVARAQAAGMFCILADTEHSWDPEWCTAHGVNYEALLALQPDHTQMFFSQIYFLVKELHAKEPDIPIVILCDSISNLPPAEELAKIEKEKSEDTYGPGRLGAQAAAISAGLRLMSNLIWRENVSLMFVSQLKDDPSKMFGKNSHKYGGNAINFGAGLLIETRRASKLKKPDKGALEFGLRIQVMTEKNKFNPHEPKRVATFDLDYVNGIDQYSIAVEFLKRLGQAEVAGGYIIYEGDKLRQGQLVKRLQERGPTFIENLYHDLGVVARGTNVQVVEAPILPDIVPTQTSELEDGVVVEEA